MLTDLDCADLCLAQYDGKPIFDHIFHTCGVDYAIRFYPDCAAVVFEGSHNLPDWVSNFQAAMIDVPNFAGVERGFYTGMPEVAVQAAPLLPKTAPVYVTGHSRGAAHALIFAAMLIKQGYNVIVVVFGSPRPGDKRLAAILAQAPVRSYRNYHDFDEQDFVCDVPLDLRLVAPYVHPARQIVIDVPPVPDDPWMLLARHHLYLYRTGLEGLQHG